MMRYYLDFEKPIKELEEELVRTRELAAANSKKHGGDLRKLENKLSKLQKEVYESLTPWQRIQLARHPERPYTMDYVANMLDYFVEMHGDRQFAEDKAIVGGLGQMGDITLVLIGHQKGRDTKQKLAHNFGMPNPEGYRKALRLMQMAEKFKKPIVTLIDTPGAYPGIGAEERGQSEAIALNLREMARLKVPIVAVVTGEGSSGGALAIGLADRILMLENSVYSVISPEACASILFRDSSRACEAAEPLRLTAQDAVNFGIADEIVAEPAGGAHRSHLQMAQMLKEAVTRNITQLQAFSVEELLSLRYNKYRRIGDSENGDE